MHRLITHCPENKIADHINGDKLDNRRENLRIVDRNENAQNKRKLAGNNEASKYIGVYLNSQKTKYKARIGINKININLESYVNEIDAAKARDMYIVHKLPNSLFNLNFPELKNEYLVTKFIEKIPQKIMHVKPKEVTIKTLFNVVDENTVQILIPTRPDVCVLIDKDDYDRVKYNAYHISMGYACNRKHALHRFIMNETESEVFIDHIDRNPLNNRKNNLRRSNVQLNSQNLSKRKGTSSKYMGVSYIQKDKKWKSRVGTTHIGRFLTEDEAAKARDLYILNNLPDSQYPLNFPNIVQDRIALNEIIQQYIDICL
jgi:hypothetical protein